MATVEEVVKDIQSLGMRSFSPVACAKWLDNRYKELVARIRFKNLRKVGELSLPALVETGTVSATRDSTAITGDSTTWATSPGVATHTQYWIKIRTAWYKIASVASDTALTLNSAFAEDSVTDATYKIVRRFHSLASDARWLGLFVHPKLRQRLNMMTEEEFDISYPGRPIAGIYPISVCEAGVDSSGYTQVEIYPPPLESEMIHYIYWSLPTALTLSSTIPQIIDAYVLREGALIDAYTSASIAELNLGNIEAASVYSNSAAKQRTIWERKINDACRTQRGSDDLSFIITNFGGPRKTGSIRTARDHVLLNWSR
jgi:hypothetical protein